MKRVYIIYEGVTFSVSGREPDELRAEIEDAVRAGQPHWLRVNHGEGTPSATDLLIAPGVGIALSVPGGGPADEFGDQDTDVPTSAPGGPLAGSTEGDGAMSVGELAGDE